MQHIPGSKYPWGVGPFFLLRVAYLADNVFEREAGDFLEFPDAHGYKLVGHPGDHQVLAFRDAEKNNYFRDRMFMQEWGFFRLLHKAHLMVELAFNREEWILDDGVQENRIATIQENSKASVTTEFLPRLAFTWALAKLRQPQERISVCKIRLMSYVQKARHLAVHFYNLAEQSLRNNVGLRHPACWQYLSVFVSVIVLCEYIELAIIGEDFQLVWIDAQKPFVYPGFFKKQFLQSCFEYIEWCPTETFSALRFLSFSLFIVLWSFDRRSKGQNHSRLEEQRDACVCEIVNRQLLQPIHTTQCTDCGSWISEVQWEKVDSEALRIVTKDQIPVLLVEFQDHHGVEMSITTLPTQGAHRIESYIAISHLWSDGLGPGIHDRIPACQMLRVANLVDSCSQKMGLTHLPFWLDSICVPLSAPQIGDKARQRMVEIYHGATAVIVLDSGLDDVNLQQESAAVVLARIAFSRWATRGWTFQEGAYARKLFFCVGSELITYQDLELLNLEQVLSSVPPALVEKVAVEERAQVLEEMSYGSSCFYLSRRHLSRFSEWMSHSQEDMAARLGQLWRSLGTRVVSHKSDEALILNGLLGTPLQLDQIDGHDRMKELFMSFSEMPVSMLFHVRERYGEPGLRWIPRSVMRSQLNMIRRDSRSISQSRAKITSKGVEISTGGMLFQVPDQFKTPQQAIAVSQDDVNYWFANAVDHQILRINRLSNFQTPKIGIVFPPPRHFEHKEPRRVPGAALLVVIMDMDESTLYSEHFGYWYVNAAPNTADFRKTWCVVDGIPVEPGQKWCIG